jgi:RimJ/RimL family protein N-acetyltransferase
VKISFPVTLMGKRTALREFRPDDAEATLPVIGDDRVTDWLSFDSRTLEQAEAMIAGAVERAQVQPRNEYYLGVTKLGSDELIGFARIGLNGVHAAKLGYAIRFDDWGHGYATDAARTLIDFGFRELDLHRVSAAIGPDNQPSIRLVERLGFQREGRIRDHVFTNGAWRDSLLYSVLAEDWKPEAAQPA